MVRLRIYLKNDVLVGGKKMKHIRLRGLLREFLAEGPKSFPEIKKHINERTKWGTSDHSLGMILQRSPNIKQVERVMTRGTYTTTYTSVWGLKDE